MVLESRSDVDEELGVAIVDRDELGEGGCVEGQGGVDEGSVRSRRSVLPAATEGRLASEGGDEVESVEGEERGDL